MKQPFLWCIMQVKSMMVPSELQAMSGYVFALIDWGHLLVQIRLFRQWNRGGDVRG